MSVDPHYKVQIRYHTLVDEKYPFVLYGVEVHSPYSKAIVTKRYNHFAILHAQLATNFKDITVITPKKK